MINKYLDFINDNFNVNESFQRKSSVIYWNENVDEVLNENWSDISVSRYNYPIYVIKFKVEGKESNDYSVVFEGNKTRDIYYMENPEPFIKKFKEEFFKNAIEYVVNMKYDPVVLGDLEHIRNSNKFNI